MITQFRALETASLETMSVEESARFDQAAEDEEIRREVVEL